MKTEIMESSSSSSQSPSETQPSETQLFAGEWTGDNTSLDKDDAVEEKTLLPWLRRLCRAHQQLSTTNIDTASPSASRTTSKSHRQSKPVLSMDTVSLEMSAVGLRNLGNTCYANAALQVLIHTQPLWSYLDECRDFYYASCAFSSADGRDSFADAQEDNEAPLLNTFLDFLFVRVRPLAARGPHRSLPKPDLDTADPILVSPLRILREMQSHFPHFQAYQQHDSAEFLRCLLSGMQEEIEKLLQRPADTLHATSIAEQDITETTNLESPNIASSPRTPKPPSAQKPPPRSTIIHDLFEGTLQSHVQCLQCGKDYYRDETFLDLPVQISSPTTAAATNNADPADENGESGGKRKKATSTRSSFSSNNNNRSSGNGTSSGWFPGWVSEIGGWLGFSGRAIPLQACLESFFETESLVGEERYQCDNCKARTDGRKTLYLKHLPEILILHMKRFHYGSYFSSKIRTHVAFPETDLDVSDYVKLPEVLHTSTSYDLYAMVQHQGSSMSSGHYVAYIKSPEDGGWFELNDESVVRRTWEEVQQVEAYILFYRKKPFDPRASGKTHFVPEKLSADTCLVSKLWGLRLMCFSHPGPLSLRELMCPHGYIDALSFPHYRRLLLPVPSMLALEWARAYGHDRTGLLHSVSTCKQCESTTQRLQDRRDTETKVVLDLDSTSIGDGELWYLLHHGWLEQWNLFRNGGPVPGPITNDKLLDGKDGAPKAGLLRGKHYRGINEQVWKFLYAIYGGGPAIARKSIDIYDDPVDDVTVPVTTTPLATSNESISKGAFNDRTD